MQTHDVKVPQRDQRPLVAPEGFSQTREDVGSVQTHRLASGIGQTPEGCANAHGFGPTSEGGPTPEGGHTSGVAKRLSTGASSEERARDSTIKQGETKLRKHKQNQRARVNTRARTRYTLTTVLQLHYLLYVLIYRYEYRLRYRSQRTVHCTWPLSSTLRFPTLHEHVAACSLALPAAQL